MVLVYTDFTYGFYFISFMPPITFTPHFPYTTLFRSNCPRSGRCAVSRSRWTDLKSRSPRSEEHTSELQSRGHLVCRLLLEKKNSIDIQTRVILVTPKYIILTDTA